MIFISIRVPYYAWVVCKRYWRAQSKQQIPIDIIQEQKHTKGTLAWRDKEALIKAVVHWIVFFSHSKHRVSSWKHMTKMSLPELKIQRWVEKAIESFYNFMPNQSMMNLSNSVNLYLTVEMICFKEHSWRL